MVKGFEEKRTEGKGKMKPPHLKKARGTYSGADGNTRDQKTKRKVGLM